MSTPLLGLILPTTGSLSGAWGTAINDSITSLLDSAVAGTTTLSADDNVTLTTDNDVANQARQAILLWTATGTVTRNITAPLRSKPYIVINASSTQSIVLRATGPTTGVIIEAGEKALCVFNTNTNDFVKIATSNSQIKISVTPEQFGAVGNGVTNDRAALQSALDSGFDVFLTLGKTYYYTGASLKMTTHNQAISGGGVLRPSGAINALVVGAENEVAVTAAGANLIVGKSYFIHDLGTTTQTDWNIIAGTSGSPQVYVVGSYFIAAVTGTGIGSGKAWLTTFGNEISIDVDAYTQTAGYYALYIGCGNRIKVSRLYAPNAGAGLYVTKSNTVSVEWMWATLRGPGITWYGNALQRSDILNIVFAVVVPGATYYGLNWDGNCHTLTAKYLGMVGDSSGGKGMIIQNTSGSTIPAVGRFGQVEIDYPQSHAVEIVTAYDIDFEMPYLLGAGKLSGSASVIPNLDGIRIGSAVTSYEVRISGGKSVGNSGYGINALGGIIYLAGNTSLYNNGGADNGGAYNNPTNNIQNRVPWYSVDDGFYLAKSSNNPIVVFNPFSSFAYDRTNKALNLQIANSAASAGVGVITFTNSYVNNLLPLYAGANGVAGGEVRWYGSTSGYMRFVVPATVTSTTYTWPAAPINGYFLQTDSSGTLSWAPASGGGGGGVATVTASLPVVSSGGTNPIISVNAASAATASVLVVRDANADFAGRIITATQFTAGSNFYITLSGTDAVLSFDATDYLSYDRTNNQYNFQIGGSGVLASNTTALQSYKPIRIQGSTSGYVGFAAQAVAGGTTYTWPSSPIDTYFLKTDGSGNLSWAAPAVAASALTGNTLSSSVTSSSLTGVGTIATGVWQGSAIADTYLGTISTASKVSNSATTATSANTASAIVARDASGNFTAGTITATQYTVAANYYLTLSSSNPNIVFDATDYLSYDRTNNSYNFIISGAGKFIVAPTYTQSLVPHVLPQYTVSTLPTGIQGAMAYVTDSSVTTYGATVIAGPPNNVVKVFFNGTAWVVG